MDKAMCIRPGAYQLILNKDEAQALVEVLAAIGGGGPFRDLTTNILTALESADLEFTDPDTVPLPFTGELYVHST